MKLKFVTPAAEREFLGLPTDVKEDFLSSIHQIMIGKEPLLKKTYLQIVGKGAIELKINGSPAYRVIYVAKYNDTLYILSSFSKTTNGVDKKAMKLAKDRYKEIKIDDS